MERRQFFIGGIPALLYGAPSDRVWLFLHGQQGRKEEALPFAHAACPRGAQVLAVDLPGHGARRERSEDLTPWAAEPELRAVQAYLDARWRSFSTSASRAATLAPAWAGGLHRKVWDVPDPTSQGALGFRLSPRASPAATWAWRI